MSSVIITEDEKAVSHMQKKTLDFLKTRDWLQLARRFSEETVPHVKQRPVNHTAANLESRVQKKEPYYTFLSPDQHL